MASGHRKEVMAKIVQFHEKGAPEALKLNEVTLSPVVEIGVVFRHLESNRQIGRIAVTV
jgi:hypothetical protein